MPTCGKGQPFLAAALEVRCRMFRKVGETSILVWLIAHAARRRHDL
jgi:hypothetical protein